MSLVKFSIFFVIGIVFSLSAQAEPLTPSVEQSLRSDANALKIITEKERRLKSLMLDVKIKEASAQLEGLDAPASVAVAPAPNPASLLSGMALPPSAPAAGLSAVEVFGNNAILVDGGRRYVVSTGSDLPGNWTVSHINANAVHLKSGRKTKALPIAATSPAPAPGARSPAFAFQPGM